MIRIITSLVAVFTVASIHSQTDKQNVIPKLIISITIDQMRSDYLDLFKNSLSEDGFNRLLNEGLVYANLEFDYSNLNSASSLATIYTGANPFYHNITGKDRFSAERNAEYSIFEDLTVSGKNTKEQLSPKALKISTLTDELRNATKGHSLIYSLAPNSYQALIAGGLGANGSFWLDDFSGKWASSTYYKDFHWVIDFQNKNSQYSRYPEYLNWQLSKELNTYQNIPYVPEIKYIDYRWSANTLNLYQQLKETPFVNDYITETAIQLIEKNDMGKHLYPDFLALSYYAGNFNSSDPQEYSVEQQDIYYRLDKNLSTLIDSVDKLVGLKNTLFVISPTGYYKSFEEKNDEGNIFYPNRCEALLNMYLVALYGKEQWVERFHDKQIYLDRKLIESKGISLKEIQNKVAEFVVQFNGVQDVATLIGLLNGESSVNMSSLKNSLDKDFAGDVFIEIKPNFQIVDERIQVTTKNIAKDVAVVAPVIFFGYNIKPKKIQTSVSATQIAPTVSRILRIRSPNGTKQQSLPEFL